MSEKSKAYTDQEIITHAIKLLKNGLSPAHLPGKLIEAFGLSADAADDLASAAIRRLNRETKPIDGPII